MPHIEINREEFEELLGQEVTDQRLMEEASLLGAHWTHVEGKKWDVEVYPDRPDLLSVEGLARAYRGFFEIDEGLEKYEVERGDVEVEIDPTVEEVRPFIGGAVVRGLELDERMINGLIQLQEKLHESVGRRRDKIAIGLHDLGSLEPPFEYRAVKPESVTFTPLEHDEQMHLDDILEEHKKGREYAWILEGEEKYPLISDDEGKVLSFPPIINNQITEVTEGTKDIFIDVTGKDERTVEKVLNILVTALAERGGKIESVKVDGVYMPDLSPSRKELDPSYFREVSGIDTIGMNISERLEKMRFGAEVDEGSQMIDVEVPCYRTDIMHQYDIIEDAVIATRYEEIRPVLPEVDQIAEQRPIEKFSDEIRDLLVGSGAIETHTYVLSSEEKLFDKMDMESQPLAEMSNALTEDYAVARNWLLPSLMQVLKNNRHRKYPQELFEIAETVQLDTESNTGASNRKKLAYVEAGSEKDYTDAREALQQLERYLGIEFDIKAEEKEFFEPGRAASVELQGEYVGFIGEFSDAVVKNWEIEASIVGFELDVQKIYSGLDGG